MHHYVSETRKDEAISQNRKNVMKWKPLNKGQHKSQIRKHIQQGREIKKKKKKEQQDQEKRAEEEKKLSTKIKRIPARKKQHG